jgi:arylsulfatase A-like enzyme
MHAAPNILFITSDQQRWDHIGALGMPGLPTPALDRIATQGAHFTRAYCPTPLCTPTRLTLLTGLLPSVHRGHTLGVTPDPFPAPTIPARLKAAGYRTGLVGKTHFTERRHEEAHLLAEIGAYASDADWPFDGPYVGFDDVQVASGHSANTVPAMHYRRYLERTGQDWAAWFPKVVTGTYDGEHAGPWEIPAEHHNTAWVGREAERWISQQTPDAPWFLWVSFEDPHEPMQCPQPWYGRVDRSALRPYETDRPGEFDDRPPFYAQIAGGDLSEINDTHLTPCVFPRRRLDQNAISALQATIGMVGFLDHQVGQLLRLLEHRGEIENTVIVYTSDHGEMHGHHGFWGKGFTAYEDCQRVPLLIWAPGQPGWRQGHSEALVSLADLPRLFLHLAGLPTPQGVQGADLLPYLADHAAPPPRRGVCIEANLTARIHQLTYVNQTHKIVVYREQDDWGELYDLTTDPDQYTNLWDHDLPLRAHLLAELTRQRLRDEGHAHPRASFG